MFSLRFFEFILEILFLFGQFLILSKDTAKKSVYFILQVCSFLLWFIFNFLQELYGAHVRIVRIWEVFD